MKLQGSDQKTVAIKSRLEKKLSISLISTLQPVGFHLYFPTFATHLRFYVNKVSITHKAPKVSAGAERQQGVTVNRYQCQR